MHTYLFHRSNGFYPLDLPSDHDAVKNAEANEGTVMVTDITGRIVWGWLGGANVKQIGPLQ